MREGVLQGSTQRMQNIMATKSCGKTIVYHIDILSVVGFRELGGPQVLSML